MKLLAGMLKQTLNVSETLEVFERKADAGESQRPVLAAGDKKRCLRSFVG